MQTDSLLLDIYYWMEFADEEELLSELQDCDPDEWDIYKNFSDMMARCVNKLKVK